MRIDVYALAMSWKNISIDTTHKFLARGTVTLAKPPTITKSEPIWHQNKSFYTNGQDVTLTIPYLNKGDIVYIYLMSPDTRAQTEIVTKGYDYERKKVYGYIAASKELGSCEKYKKGQLPPPFFFGATTSKSGLHVPTVGTTKWYWTEAQFNEDQSDVAVRMREASKLANVNLIGSDLDSIIVNDSGANNLESSVPDHETSTEELIEEKQTMEIDGSRRRNIVTVRASIAAYVTTFMGPNGVCLAASPIPTDEWKWNDDILQVLLKKCPNPKWIETVNVDHSTKQVGNVERTFREAQEMAKSERKRSPPVEGTLNDNDSANGSDDHDDIDASEDNDDHDARALGHMLHTSKYPFVAQDVWHAQERVIKTLPDWHKDPRTNAAKSGLKAIFHRVTSGAMLNEVREELPPQGESKRTQKGK